MLKLIIYLLLQQEASKDINKKGETNEATEAAVSDEKKNDKVTPDEKKQGSVETDGDAIEPEDCLKKKKKKGAKEESKEKGNFIY